MFNFIISHKGSYDSGNEISSFISDKSIANNLRSFIRESVTYGDLLDYVSSEFCTSSFRSLKDYSIFTETTWQNDGRNYVQTRVSLFNNDDEFKAKLRINQKDTFKERLPEGSFEKICYYTLLSVVSEKSTVYFIADEEQQIDFIRRMLNSLGMPLIKRISYIETVAILPSSGYANVVVCHCINDGDRAKFHKQLDKIGSKTVFDFGIDKVKCSVEISNPSFCSTAFEKLSPDCGIKSLLDNFLRTINYVQLDNELNNQDFFNLLLYQMLRKYFPQYIREIPCSDNEKQSIEHCYCREI